MAKDYNPSSEGERAHFDSALNQHFLQRGEKLRILPIAKAGGIRRMFLMKKIRHSADCGGLDFLDALTLLFIGLKLTGTIDWSWWWVLSPVWISFSVALFLVVVLLILKAVKNSIE